MRNLNRVGIGLFALGLAVALVLLAPLVVPGAPVVPVLWFAAMLTGVGFAVILWGLWINSRRRRQSVRSAQSEVRSANPT